MFCCSPFNTRILPSFDASKVIVTGDGVQPSGVLASLSTSFVIDTRDAGLADLDVLIQVSEIFVKLWKREDCSTIFHLLQWKTYLIVFFLSIDDFNFRYDMRQRRNDLTYDMLHKYHHVIVNDHEYNIFRFCNVVNIKSYR